ncbi:hypothetical protein pb186bvf_017900 [Paramecium bursaria]
MIIREQFHIIFKKSQHVSSKIYPQYMIDNCSLIILDKHFDSKEQEKSFRSLSFFFFFSNKMYFLQNQLIIFDKVKNMKIVLLKKLFNSISMKN